jgi:DNA-dependent RNA polymerase auxiliary subunit epsilon|tara:strand:+ start:38 stop:232 length:195 start_codon:yes stop_codon:yes gene_type:complete
MNKINSIKKAQLAKLDEKCRLMDIDFDSMKTLLDSVRTRKLFKRNNYHQETIDSIIEKSTDNEN